MNMEKTLKNSIISVLGQMMTLFLQFINRRIFIIFLNIELLGYQSLFGNVFSLLSVAELGIGNIISYHLYKELAEDNTEEIGKLMYLYKWVYRAIAMIVLLGGGLGYFTLPFIVKNPTKDWSYLHLIYFLQLGCIVAGYFLSYKRTIYIANQKEYKCVEIDLYTNIIVQIVQLTTLAIFRNYLLYLAIQLSTTLIANAIIAQKSNNDYPYLKNKYSIDKSDIVKRNMIPDVKNFIVHKICYAIYGGTDNIVISAFCGIRDVALYGNYFLLQKGIMQVFFYKLLNPVQATIGNIVYSKRSKESLWEQFQIFDIFSFYFASYIGLGFLLFFQIAIQIWLGQQYLISFPFVIVYSITIYFGALWEIMYKYRSVFGDYSKDRNCMIVSALLNIIISVLLAKKYGVIGVQIGTLFAFIPIAYGRIRFVVNGFFGKSSLKYILKHLTLFGVVAIEWLLAICITCNMPISFTGILMRGGVWFTIPLAFGILINVRNPYFKGLLGYLRKTIIIIKSKKREKGNS